MGVGAGLYVYDVVVRKFTFALSSRDEFLFFIMIYESVFSACIVNFWINLRDSVVDAYCVRSSLNALHLIYKHDVIHILYKQLWFSALCSLFRNWPGGSSVSVLSCELNGQGSCPAWAIFFGYISLST